MSLTPSHHLCLFSFILAFFIWLSFPDAPTSVFLLLELASFCPLHPGVHPATTQVSSQVPPPPFAPLLSGGLKSLSCQMCAPVEPCLGLEVLARVLPLLTIQSLAGLRGSCCSGSGSCYFPWCPLGGVAGFGPGKKEPGIWVQFLC